MKAIILAAGKGVRMGPLTLKTPKPLLKIKGKPIIDYILDSIPREIDEVIIVVKYLASQIKKHIGDKRGYLKIKYVLGSDKGNAYSFLATRNYLKNERFLLIYGDEIPDPVNVKACLAKALSVLVFKSSIKDGVMVLNTDIFNYQPEDDCQFSTMVESFCRDHKVAFVKAKNFAGELNTPDAFEKLNKTL